MIHAQAEIGDGIYIRYDSFSRGIADMMKQQIAKEVKDRMEKVVRDWKSKPTFETHFQKQSGQYVLRVFPTGDVARIWRYLSGGVEGRFIAPNGPYPLKFRAGYHARTKPGAPYYSGPGTRYGPTIRSMGHWWPGIAPRNFEGGILEDYTPTYISAVVRGVGKALFGSR